MIVKHGKPAEHLCNKDPLVLRYSSYMKGVFPNSKFVLMIRDGRATVHSIITRRVTITGFNLDSYRDCLVRWNNIIEHMYAQCIEGKSTQTTHFNSHILLLIVLKTIKSDPNLVCRSTTNNSCYTQRRQPKTYSTFWTSHGTRPFSITRSTSATRSRSRKSSARRTKLSNRWTWKRCRRGWGKSLPMFSPTWTRLRPCCASSATIPRLIRPTTAILIPRSKRTRSIFNRIGIIGRS